MEQRIFWKLLSVFGLSRPLWYWAGRRNLYIFEPSLIYGAISNPIAALFVSLGDRDKLSELAETGKP